MGAARIDHARMYGTNLLHSDLETPATRKHDKRPKFHVGKFQWHRAGAHLLYIWKFYYILVEKSYAAATVRDRRSRKVRSVTSIKVRRAVAVFPTTSNQVHPPTLWSTALSSDFDRHRRAVPCRNAPHHARCTRRRVSLDRHWHERDSVRVVAMRERRRAPATVPLSLE